MAGSNIEYLRQTLRQMRNEAWYFQEGLMRGGDIWLASYPRSGSHSVRFILASARHFMRHGSFPQDLSGMKTVPGFMVAGWSSPRERRTFSSPIPFRSPQPQDHPFDP